MDLHDFAPHYRIMFAPYCPRHQSRILLGYESVVAIEHTPSGPKVLLVCHCGELVTHTATEPAADAGSAESRCRTRV